MTINKNDLIKKLLNKKNSKRKSALTAEKSYPRLRAAGHKKGTLSPAQRRIYLLSKMNGQKDVAYNLPEVLKVTGEYSIEQAQRTVENVIKRHDILRTAFTMEEGVIVQEVHENVEFNVDNIVVSHEEFDSWLEGYIRPFDLEKPCLLRCALVEAGTDQYIVFDSHHIIGDGFSAGIVNSEFARADQPENLAAPTFQYLDYVNWTKQFLRSENFKKQESYWLKALSGNIPLLDLPLDIARPERKDFLGATVEFSLGDASESLRALFKAERITLFTGLISAYSVFLSKLTQQESIYIATPVAGRPLPEMQNLPGMFVNTLPVITRPRSALSFSEFLHEVKQAAFACQQNADCDVSHIVDRLGLKRNPSRNPLFDTLFVLQVKNLDTFDNTSLGIEPYAFNRGRSQFDLSMEAVERGSEIVFKLDYATALFSEETVLRFRDQFLNLLQEIVAEPSATLASLSLIDKRTSERLSRWVPPIQLDQMAPIGDVFDQVSNRFPNQTALMFEGAALTYRELNQKVHNLAFNLKEKGVVEGDFVALLLDRSFDMIISIFAIIKAGAAYVPIDPDYPDERVQFTLQDSNAKLLITQPHICNAKERLFSTLSLGIVENVSDYLEGDHSVLTRNRVTDVLYVIYTSGTTGVPKGVMVEHRCLFSLIFGNQKLDFSSNDNWVLFHSFAFDVSVWEIFASLLNGSTLFIPPKEITKNTQDFRQYVKDNGITVLNQTPSAFYRFAEIEHQCNDSLSLRWVNFAGEALLPGRLASWYQKYPDTALINMYGITETTIHTSYKKLTVDDIDNGECSNIGVSLDSLSIYLLDKDLQLCAPGVIGEIYVGGWGVARGYINRQELNEERFLPDPFVTDGRMYKSGDLAKWTHANELEYLGRNDQQVKIRGYRIECGEIENRIIKLCNIASAAVFDKVDARGEKYLCAVLHVESLSDEAVKTLKSQLLQFLPAYMIPNQIVSIQEMPLTSNGKLDRRQLSAYMDNYQPEIEYIAPETPTEAALAALWSRYFPKAGKIGRQHDFFDLGGHSLLAIELVLEIKKEFGKDVALDVIFNSSSVIDLAVAIDGKGIQPQLKPIPIISSVNTGSGYKTSATQKRLFFIDQLTPPPGIAYNVPVIFEVEGRVDTVALQRNIAGIVLRHESLRTQFSLVDDELRQFIMPESACCLHKQHYSIENKEHVIGEFIQPFDVKTGPLFRAKYATFEHSTTALLMFDFHHIICDGVSLNVFLAELSALSHGKALGDCSVQFKDFAVWWEGEPKLVEDKRYWSKQLAGSQPLALFTDFPREAAQSFKGGEVYFHLEPRQHEQLMALSQQHKVTPYMVYMAVFSLLLSKISGQKDIVVGSPFSGRPHPEIQQTIGMFVSSLPIRSRLDDSVTFVGYLQSVRKVCVEAQDHLFFQFEDIASNTGSVKDISRNPLFDCMLDVQLPREATITLADASLTPVELANPCAKMDLVLSIKDSGSHTHGTTSIECVLNYAAELFTAETVESFSKGYVRLMQQVLDEPHSLLQNLALNKYDTGIAPYIFERADNKQAVSEFHWSKRLNNVNPDLNLATDFPRTSNGYTSSSLPITVDSEWVDRLVAYSRSAEISLSTLLVSSWAALICRLSSQDHFSLGVALGPCAPLLPYNVLGNTDTTVQQLIDISEGFFSESKRYNSITTERLDALARKNHRLAEQPIFKVGVCLNETQDKPRRTLDFVSDLCLMVKLEPAGFSCELVYADNLYQESTIRTFIQLWQNILADMIENTGSSVSHLSILNDAQTREVTITWNDTEAPYPDQFDVNTLFEAQVTKTPNAIALEDVSQQITYLALDQRANQLAHYLKHTGVVAGDVVALQLERSMGIVVAELAVLKAGATYLPLDMSLPEERQHYIFKMSGCRWVLNLGEANGVIRAENVESIDLSAAHIDTMPTNALGIKRRATSAAYVMFTSGSTGKPKGVAIPHKGIARLVLNTQYAQIEAGDRVGFAANPAFDASTLETWGALLNGASCVVIPQNIVLDPVQLTAFIRTKAVNFLFLTVGLFNQYHQALGSVIPQLKYLITGGDVIDPVVVKHILVNNPPQHLLAAYGPTETTTLATTYEISLKDLDRNTIPLGYPISNTSVYILDRHLNPVPVGVIGELYVGGPGVALGYINQPGLTAERFVTNPFVQGTGDHMYKTGDLGRWLTDGTIEFAGRDDQQVKIRGFRIELGDIETTFNAIDGVQSVTVQVRESDNALGGKDKHLVAYYIGTADAHQLRESARETLPAYMIPAAYVRLDVMPLTPNGKLDRKALPAPEGDAYISQRYAAPEGEREEALAALWADLLKHEQVGRHDNFFDLGGHSLLAVQLLSRIRQTLQLDVSLNTLFSHPVLADFATALASQAPQSQLPSITLADRQQPLPLSFAQQRLWFLAQMDGVSQAYHIHGGVSLTGALDHEVLHATLNRIVARHEALRTTFLESEGVVMQSIGDIDQGLPLQIVDLQHDDQPEQAMQQALDNAANAPFDLVNGPLIRACLLKTHAQQHVLYVTMHHIISDGWSLGVLMNEVTALYATYHEDGADLSHDPLPPLAIQYPDYADWQRRWLSGDTLQQQTAYWQEALANAPALLELPADRPRPQQQSFAGAARKVVFDAALTQQLKTLSQQHGNTLFMTLLTSWGTLLSRLSGQQDVVIGSPIAGRTHHETENLIGFFVNTLALRLQIDPEASVAALLAHGKQQLLDAQQHQDLPFEQVVDTLKPPRSMAYTPIFQVMFAWQNTPEGDLSLPGLSLSTITLEAQRHAKFDLTLSLQEANGQIEGEIEFATALFEADTIDRYIEHWTTLLRAMVQEPQRRVATLPLLTDTQRTHMVEGWNQTERDYPTDLCLHQLFEQQVARTPQATALVFNGETISYHALNTRANQLAHYLREQGVSPDSRVGICLDRGVELVVALWATLKAGGAYVPLDPSYPAQRLDHMLSDSAPQVVLLDETGQQALHGLAGLGSRPQLHMHQHAERWVNAPTDNPSRDAVGLTPQHLAYIIYTSGSTGLPKGAMNEHAAVVNRLVWMQEAYDLTATDVVLQKTPFSFDVSVWEFFWPLMYGASLSIAKPDGHKDPVYLQTLIQQTNVTTLHFVPSMLQVFLEHDAVQAPSVTRVICSGEALPSNLVKRFHQRVQNVSLINLYGPTEAAIDVTEWTCDPAMTGHAVPIGRPIANTRIYVLDPQGQPVPTGVTGELYIGGVQVGRGYWNQPALTAERFLPDPFVPDNHATMYRTGDLAAFRADGILDYLGRNDFQVKLRGFRIELGEIEAKLTALPSIIESVVVAHNSQTDSGADTRLVAYVTTRDTAALDVDAVRSALADDLAAYMIPSAFITLDAMPLSPNGKLDRKALPAPEGDAYISQRYAAPEGEREEALAALWADLLKHEQVGRHDNFFDLGGHSLLAVQLLSRIRQTLQLDVSLNTLFSHPVLADFATALASQAPQSQLPSITLADRQQPLPLSFAQQRLWFLAQMDGVSQAYHIHGGVSLTGALDHEVLHATLNRIVARHEALRTTFLESEGVVMQSIGDIDQGLPLQIVDLQHDDQPEQAMQQALDNAANAPFDLVNGPLIRACLLKTHAQQHVLYVTMHHIISDGWSLGVLMNEVTALYATYHEDGADLSHDPLPPLAIQYPDYADWQRRWLSGDTLQQQTAYWQEALANAPALLELPADRPRPQQQSFAGAARKVVFDAALTQQLKTLSQQHGNTLFMTLLTSWGTLLSRLSGQQDVVIGSPIAGRTHHETENLIGFFVNTLALRLQIDPEASVAALLAHGKQQLLDAQQHQDLPFEQVVDTLKPPRSMAYTPIFQVMFAWQNTPEGDLSLPGLSLSTITLEAQRHAKFDLTLSLQEANGQIEGEIEFATALFEADTIDRYIEHWTTLLRAMVQEPQRRVATLPLLTDTQRTHMVEGWNQTERDYPTDLCLHQLFEQQVARTPQATALVFNGETISYHALNTRANQLAHYLREQGVSPDSRVGICLDRGVELVVALWATLKAGGAYVPLDPSYPAQRLDHMLSDSAPQVVLLDETGQQALHGLAGLGSRPQLHMHQHAERWANAPTDNPSRDAVGLTPQHLAYIIYTSGSTGLPKGAMNEHAAVVNRLVWMQEAYDLTATDVVLQKTPFSFDVSVWEFFWPLMYGASLSIAKPDGHKDPVYLQTLIQQTNVTTLHFVPSMLQVFLEHDAVQAPSVTRVICSGEALPSNLVKRFHQRVQNVSLINLYGPTEAAIDVTEWTCDPAMTGHAVPIGRPIANTRIYVLDPQGQPVPTGVTGELYIGGVQVGRGYWNQPALTAERFLPDPFVPDNHATMYRTGDLAAFRADGILDYLGRNDFQVKLRGFRIELGEIEAKLTALPSIIESVVVAHNSQTDSGADTRLVAYVTTRDTAALDVDAVRSALADDLAAYMIPSAFITLDAMPLSPNGKLDRKALPAPEGDAYISQRYAAPEGEREEALAALWADLLKHEQVGRHDNFFDLGGHSLLAVQLLSRIRQTLQLDVSLNTLFSHPVLADFATALASQAPQSQLPSITLADRQQPLPLSFAQQRLWFLAQMDGVSQAYHIHGGVSLTGALDHEVLHATLNRIVARHEALRTTFLESEGVVMQSIGDIDQGLPLQIVDLQHDDQPEQAMQQALDNAANAPFDLVNGPLIRACLLKTHAQQHVLYVTMHHIISDGWSLGVLMNEVTALYATYHEDGADLSHDPLPPLAIQYPDYADWQRRWLSGDTLQQQTAYWQEALANAPALLELPADRPRPQQQSFAGAARKVVFDAALTQQLKTLSQQHGNTLFMTLLTSWGTLLSRLSGQQDVVIGSPIAGRTHHETENLIGFFVNTLALRLQIDPEASVAALLAHGKQQLLDAQQHQDLPFEQVVDTLKPPRSMAYTPIFQVMFAWQNTPEGDLSLPGLSLSTITLEAQRHAKFDLTLSLQEANGQIEGEIEFATALFEADTIDRYIEHWTTLLRAMVQEPQRRVATLPLLTDTQRTHMVEGWNQTERDYPTDLCLHQLFEQQVARTPQATALVDANGSLTYQQLNERANQVAQLLSKEGVKRGDCVLLALPRSISFVVAELAIVKSGAIYVPLDLGLPSDRLQYIHNNCQSEWLITNSLLERKFTALLNTHVLNIDSNVVVQQSKQNLKNTAAPTDAVYVMYTSGSTGMPKGVVIPHRGVSRLVLNNGYTDIQKSDHVAFVANPAFDASTFEVWGPLLNGARAVIIDQDVVFDPSKFCTALLAFDVSCMFLTVGLFNQYHEALAPAIRNLKYLLVGGDVLDATVVKKVLTHYAPKHLLNGYGPTESTTFAITHDVTLCDVVTHNIPLGQPIGNTYIHILDGNNQIQPLGVVGELFIGGDGLALGYLDQPALTAERFVVDPFNRAAKLYKTGDLGYRRADGTIVFVGRNDFQVKIRGFRIELGEIENQLCKVNGVEHLIVLALAREGEAISYDKQLVAYYTGDAQTAELKEWGKQKLPPYMVPEAYVQLDILPLNQNGKVDRKALPAPAPQAFLTKEFEAPVGEIEMSLSKIWADVLKQPSIGRHDNFFDLGGHSLLAVSLIERMRKIGLHADVQAIFMSETLADLALAVRQRGTQQDVEIPPNLIPEQIHETIDSDIDEDSIEEFRL
ncbi:non-ribosomal peptide synthetase [Teredinibacter purpureus]|uniref:non-ribosomal peptide synthetase n=1 Tax=Teredinibacter purpureus TaxID=2731756 RepID=UPI0005F7CEBA|nr:non-ribosomal peptide synthetase [Teredinibacter purpureus]